MLKPFGAKAHRFAYRHPKYDKRMTILQGAVRSSKTWSLMVKIILFLCHYQVGGRKVIVGQSKAAVLTNVLTDIFLMVGANNYRYNRQSGELLLLNSHWNIYGARDEGSERAIRGSTIGTAVVDEGSLVPESFFLMLNSRCSVDNARIYISSNPDRPTHYLKKDFIDNEELVRRGMLEDIQFKLSDNPNLSEEFKENLKYSYTGLFRRRFIEGEWCSGKGGIYTNCFRDDTLFDESTRPIGLYGPGGYEAHYLAIDYGTRDEFVALEILDDGNVCYVIRAYVYDSAITEVQKTDFEYADELDRWLQDSPVGRTDDLQIIIDPSAASFKMELIKRGRWVRDAVNEVAEGLRITSTMMANGQLRWHARNCAHSIAEMQSYAWDDKAAKIGLEKPNHEGSHSPDAARYFCATAIGTSWRLGRAA